MPAPHRCVHRSVARRVGRRAALLAEERKQPLGWHYLSFANNTGFLGGAIVRGRGILTAIERCDKLGINPGGEVMSWRIPTADLHRVTPGLRNRLLSEREVREKLQGERVS
jgi:hypothetical protein